MKMELDQVLNPTHPAPNLLANLQPNQKGRNEKHNQTQFLKKLNFFDPSYFEKRENIKSQKKATRNPKEDSNSQKIICEYKKK
jgi:hypothetical protein